ncbi:uncharacterized protein LOC116925949 isoform X1 [Daphnia magna]|nr:uncharacterized protein LOC116925949 isoform X1 [Daphnia magna]XP_045030604.1 uncharacterized protein LOC116925949 isoform X1 [Daphnia magna]
MCGNSEFKAAQEVSSQRKNLDVAGNMMVSCGHATILTSVDMKESESYRHTLLLARKVLKERNCKFLVNDVVCHFWFFLASLAVLLPKAFGDFTQRLIPFLSRLHGQAHAWYCQIIYFGHWKDGAGGTLGEEQEQVFSTFSRYCNVTKYMSRASRNDFLTMAMFYWNSRKEAGLPLFLTKRLLNSCYRVKFYSIMLTDKLNARCMKDESELMGLQQNLEAEAKTHLDGDRRILTRIQSENTKRSLVGTHLEWVSINDRIQTVAVTSKWRQKLVSKRRKLESKAANLIQDINEKSVMGEELVTTEHFNSGIFPWDFANKISFQDNFKLVDCWNLKKRNQECIVHTKKEMRNYLYSISNDLMERRNEIGVLTGASDLRSKGELSIKCIEYSRLIALLRNALSYYRFFGEETSGEFRGLAELVVESDDRDLDFFNEQSILECSENECDSDDEDDCVSG